MIRVLTDMHPPLTKTLLSILIIAVVSLSLHFDATAADTVPDVSIKNQIPLSLNSDDVYFRISGRLNVDFAAWQGAVYSGVEGESGSGNEIRRGFLFLKGNFHDWQFRFLTNLNKDGANVLDAYIKYTGFTGVELMLGNQPEPFSLDNLSSSRFSPATERTITGNGHFAGDRNFGLTIAGHGDNYGYQVGVFDNGSSETENNYALVGRGTVALVHQPEQVLHLGASVSLRQYDQSKPFQAKDRAGVHSTDVKSIDTGEFFAKDSFVYNLEMAYAYAKWSLSGEYQLAKLSEVNQSVKREFSSHYLQTSYFISDDRRPYDVTSGTFRGINPSSSGGAWQIFARIEKIDFNANSMGSDTTIISLGVNWFPTRYTRLSLDYFDTNIDYAALTQNGSSIDGSAVNMRAQFFW